MEKIDTVIDPIRKMRLNKRKNVTRLLQDYMAYQELLFNGVIKQERQLEKEFAKLLNIANIFVIKRELYRKTTNEQIEGLHTKFFDVIIDDSSDPFRTKKEIAVHILKKFNKKNLNKGIGMIHKTTEDIHQFGQTLGKNKKVTLMSKKKEVKL